MDEYTLAKKAISGDENAQTNLLTIYQDAMYRVAYSYMRNEHDTQDALAEMWFQALKNIHTVKSPEYFKTWLVRIVINTCLQMKRKQKKLIPVDELPEQFETMKTIFEINDAISQLSTE